MRPSAAPSLQPPQSDQDLFTNVVNIRHLGVHRRVLDLPAILQYLATAQKFADLHQDHKVSAKISSIIRDLQVIYNDLSLQQEDITTKLWLSFGRIRLQQAALEEQAEAEAIKQNQQHLTQAGAKIAELLYDRRAQRELQLTPEDSSFSGTSNIDDILIEAESLMKLTCKIENIDDFLNGRDPLLIASDSGPLL